MRNNILAIVVFYAFVSTILGGLIIYAQAKNNKQLILDLNVSQTAFKMSQSNVKSSQEDNANLRMANMALMEVLDKKGCIKAIKNTPLPKMEIK